MALPDLAHAAATDELVETVSTAEERWHFSRLEAYPTTYISRMRGRAVAVGPGPA